MHSVPPATLTLTMASPFACPVAKPLGEIESTATLELRQLAVAVMSAVEPSERCAIALSCALCPGATEPGPRISSRLITTPGGLSAIGREVGRVGDLSQATTSVATATEHDTTRIAIRMHPSHAHPRHPWPRSVSRFRACDLPL